MSNDDATGRLMDDWIRGHLGAPTSNEDENARLDAERKADEKTAADEAFDAETERIAAGIRAERGWGDPQATSVSLDGGVRRDIPAPLTAEERADGLIRRAAGRPDLDPHFQ